MTAAAEAPQFCSRPTPRLPDDSTVLLTNHVCRQVNPRRSAAWEAAWEGSGVDREVSEPSSSAAARVQVVVTTVLFVLARGNVAMLWSVTRQPAPPFFRLASAHLTALDFVTFVVMALDANWNIIVQWLAKDIAYLTLTFLKLMALYAAAFLPQLIGRDCQAAVFHPLGPQFTCKHTSGGSLGLSFLLALPQLFLFHTVCKTGPGFKDSFKAQGQETTYNLFTFCCPFTAMTICYSHITVVPVFALLVLLTSVLCWTPYYLLCLWYWFSPTKITKVPPSLNHILFFFGLINAPLDHLKEAFTLGC
ncbi:LOW QUALITY PROTEIN: gonadotropin-releasing hormone II receptor-like [Rhynchonycteris naso]